MAHEHRLARRRMSQWLLAMVTAPVSLSRTVWSRAADLPMLSPDDEAAKKVKYVEDASRAKDAKKDNKCANCALYEGAYASTQGPCQLFPGKQVRAAGWCSAWEPQI